MSDEQIISTHHLFISLLEKKNGEEKKANVLRCLEQGADVNAVDGNQRNNTPLHVAVIKDEKDIVQILLDKGAVTDVRNLDQKTPLDIARDLQTESGKQIFQLLNAWNKEPEVFEKSSRVESVPPKSADEKPIAEPSKKLKQYSYSKRPGVLGFSGHLYEIKLLTLVLLRALNDENIEDFRLGTNNDKAGCLDDMCFRFKMKGHGKPIVVFLQARHRHNRERGLTVEDICNSNSLFSLNQYLDAYLKIKENFKSNNNDDMFDGEFNNAEIYLIIYTPLKACFPRKLVSQTKSSMKVNQLINTAVTGDAIQFAYEESDLELLTNRMTDRQIVHLGSIFLYFIMAEKDKSEVMMSNEHIARYHYVLSREVIIVSDIHEIQVEKEVKQIRYGSFRPEFFTSPLEYLICLREIFYKEILSTHGLHILSRVFGKLATYNERAHKLEIKKQFKDETELEKILYDLSEQEVKPDVIREAVWLKLKEMAFRLPPQFGNLDMSFSGTEDKVKNRIKYVVEKLIPVFKNCEESKIIEINDDTVGNGKLIQPGLLGMNGGLGSAVGNLLVLDDDTKMLKFELDKELPKYSKEVLSLFLLNIDKEKLRKYRLKITIDGFPKYQFYDQYEKRQVAKEFLNKLWFYTDQAQEHEVETILKYEISKSYNDEALFKIHTNAIYLESYDKVYKWWMKPSRATYLNPKCTFFKKAKNAVIDSPMLILVNFMFIKKIQKLDISFNQDALDSLYLDEMTGRLNIKTDTNILTALKINQKLKKDKNFTFLEFEEVLSLAIGEYNILIKELKLTKMKHLIIIYEELKYYEEFCKIKLNEVMEAFNGTNIIIVSNDFVTDRNGWFEENKFVTVYDSNNYLINLTEESQKKIVESSEVVFQDDEIFIKQTIKWRIKN